MNIGALGNIVGQLHASSGARKTTSLGQALWGNGAPVPYSSAQLEERIHELKDLLASQFVADICGEEDPRR